jgi:hypothetical protein
MLIDAWEMTTRSSTTEGGWFMSHVQNQNVENRGVWTVIAFWAQHLVFGVGIIFVLVGAAIAYFGGGTPAQQDAILKTVVALGAACVGAEIPGLIKLEFSWGSAAGALAIFCLVFWVWPHFG